MQLDEIYDELESIESDFVWWQHHQDDQELAKDLAESSERLLSEVAGNDTIDKAQRHKICCSLLRINTRCTDALSGIDVSSLVSGLTAIK